MTRHGTPVAFVSSGSSVVSTFISVKIRLPASPWNVAIWSHRDWNRLPPRAESTQWT